MTTLPELTEDEHQALDLLEGDDADEEIDPEALAAARASAQGLLDRFVPAVAQMLLTAVPGVLEAQRAHLDHKDRVFTAVEHVASPAGAHADAELTWLDAIREIPLMALLQDDAEASALSGDSLIEHLRTRVEDLLARVPEALAELEREPTRAWSFGPAIATTRQVLAIPRDSTLEQMLEHGAARANEDVTLARLATIVTRWNRAAYLETVRKAAPGAAPARPTAPELVHFRIASVRAATHELRALALAADQPERIDLARVVARAEPDPARAIRAFAAAVTAAIAEERQHEQPRGRKFTRLHMTLLVILLALTAWHYWLR